MSEPMGEPISSATEKNPLASLAAQQLEQKVLAWTNEQFKAAKTARNYAERQWYLNSAFYFGKQNVQILNRSVADSLGGVALSTPKAPPWRVRLVVNKVRPIIRTEVAKLTSNKPTAVVIPATSDEKDIMAARVAENIWEAAYRDNKIDQKLHDIAWWGSICGTAFLKTYWDPTKAQGNGDVCFEAIDPFHIFVPDIKERDIEGQPFVIHGITRSPEYVKRQYGFDAAPNSHSTDPFIEETFLNTVGAQNSRLKKEVACYEVWLKENAHPEFPEGGLITIVGDRVIQMVKGFPYRHGEYPFSKFEHVQTGKFYGDSVVTDIVPLQREYNRTRSQIVEAKNLMAKPRLMAPRGSVNPRQISSEPGQVVLYTPGFSPPTPLPMEPLPSYVLEELDRIQQDIDDISGQHEISRGQNPSQVTAASALTYLNEQDESKLSASIASLEGMVEKAARQYLRLVVDYWDMPRTVKVTGKNSAFEAYQWKSDDIKNNTDIRIEAGSALPQSKAARQAFLMDMYKMGAIKPEQLFEVLDMRGLERAYEEFLVDRRQSQRENLKMSALQDVPEEMLIQPQVDPMTGQPVVDPNTGQPVPPQIPQELMPNTWDNHEAHIHFHNQYRKTQEFENLPDHVKQIFEQHVAVHQMGMMQGYQGVMGGPVVGGQMGMDPSQNVPMQEQQAMGQAPEGM